MTEIRDEQQPDEAVVDDVDESQVDSSTDDEVVEDDDIRDEGDIAADYIEELLDIADLDGDIDIEVRDGRTYVSVVSEDHDERLDGLVGPDGRTLEALQELVRLAVLAATGHRSRPVSYTHLRAHETS